jgi:hypothetical protein
MKLAGYAEFPVAPVVMVPSGGVALSSGLLLLRRTRKKANNRTTMATMVPPMDAPTMAPTGVEEEDPDELAADVAPAEEVVAVPLVVVSVVAATGLSSTTVRSIRSRVI